MSAELGPMIAHAGSDAVRDRVVRATRWLLWGAVEEREQRIGRDQLVEMFVRVPVEDIGALAGLTKRAAAKHIRSAIAEGTLEGVEVTRAKIADPRTLFGSKSVLAVKWGSMP